MGKFILKRACMDIQKMNRVSGQSLRISVNISPSQLEQKNWSRHVMELLSHYDFWKNRWSLNSRNVYFRITPRKWPENWKISGETASRSVWTISAWDMGLWYIFRTILSRK
ncbi:hypothetical protein DW241_01845 [Hungatella hathewayi]|nr:hypothetical protein DW241_01845 [Hungatella hathewayi]